MLSALLNKLSLAARTAIGYAEPKTLIMLVGPSCSGKSYTRMELIRLCMDKFGHYPVVLSTDDYIEAVAQAEGKKYNDVFQDEFKAAKTSMMNAADECVQIGCSVVIVDQTNLTHKSRNRWYTKFKGYTCIIIDTMLGVDQHAILIKNRTHKQIPDKVISEQRALYDGSYPLPGVKVIRAYA